MAKLGNETKLVLKLANERMKALRESRLLRQQEGNVWREGYDKAYQDWDGMLAYIAKELEEGR